MGIEGHQPLQTRIQVNNGTIRVGWFGQYAFNVFELQKKGFFTKKTQKNN
jgi:hypothetical protein